MYIQNTMARNSIAALGAVLSGLLIVARPAVVGKAKVYTRKAVSRISGSNSVYAVKRLMRLASIPLKFRQPIRIKDIRGERNVWTKGYYYIEEHDATNLHHDFTIIVNGKCYRMARSAVLGTSPKSGFMDVFPSLSERTGWILQPEHFLDEVPNPPFKESGYGAGTCKVLKEGHCYAMISSGENLHVMFEDIDGVYTFIETEGRQVLMMRKHHHGKWFGKHIMSVSESVSDYANDSDYVFTEKKDGAAIEWQVVKSSSGDKHLIIHSYRPNARIMKEVGQHVQIDHTYRLSICDKKLPDSTPICSGRGELWIDSPNGRLEVSSLLNSGHFRARNLNYPVRLYVHDLLEYEGSNVEHMSFKYKLSVFNQLRKIDRRFGIPKVAFSSKDKYALYANGKKANAIDGIVAWNYEAKNSRPIKIKYTSIQEDWHTATIVDIIPQAGKDSDKYGYPILENEHSIRFQCSGRGLTNNVKADMLSNKDKYIGLEVKYAADSHFEKSTGKPFQPSIKEIMYVKSDVINNFNPDFTADEMYKLGTLKDQYHKDDPDYQNYFNVSASLQTWPEDWKHNSAPDGWYQWYQGYCKGIRTEDDERQMRRWIAFKNRHYKPLKRADPSLSDISIQTRRRQALLNWGIDAGVNESDIKSLRS